MPSFQYRALDKAGQVLSGEIDASTSDEVFSRLEYLGYLPIDAKEAGRSAPQVSSFLTLFSNKPTHEEITVLTQDLAMLVRGGVVLDEALTILAQMGTRPSVARLLRQLHAGIADGKSFAEVLGQHPDIFSQIYVKMIEVAEATGSMEQTLENIARDRSRTERLRNNIRSALRYPSFLIVAAIGVLIFVLFYVIPEFDKALMNFNTELESSTQFIFELSRFARANSDYLMVGGAVFLLLILVLARSRRALALLLRFLGVVPGTRRIISYERTVRFCGALGALLGNGVDITAALRLTRDLFAGEPAAAQIDTLVADIRQGRRLTDSLDRLNLVPGYVVHMLRVGEESGELAAMADRITRFYEAKLDTSLERLTTIFGSTMMILVSLMVAWLIVSVLTALISVNDMLL